MSARTRAARRAATAAGAVALVVGGACAPVRDQTARQDVESLQSSVQQMESTLQARQAGVYEQIRELREEQARLERLIEENTRQGRAAAQQLEALRQKTGEDFQKRDQAQREAAQAGAERLGRIEARLDALQKGLLTVNDNLVAMSEFEKKQEERLAKVQEQFQGQLKVVVEEVGRENQDLSRGLASARADLEATRQETAAVRQGLVELQRPMQELAEQLAAVQTQIQDLGRRLESQRKAAPARSGSTHTVRAGETLTAIAARYGVSVKALRDKNQLSDADSLREGQKLAIPEP